MPLKTTTEKAYIFQTAQNLMVEMLSSQFFKAEPLLCGDAAGSTPMALHPYKGGIITE